MVSVRPLSRVVGPLPNGRFMAYKWGLLTTKWDDPPSRDLVKKNEKKQRRSGVTSCKVVGRFHGPGLKAPLSMLYIYGG